MADILQAEIDKLQNEMGEMKKNMDEALTRNELNWWQMFNKQWKRLNVEKKALVDKLISITRPASKPPYQEAKRNLELLAKMEHTKTQPDLWREAVSAKDLTPVEDNPTDWNLKATGVSFHSNFEGVPQTFVCLRAKKNHKLLKLIASGSSRYSLVTGPPQSGKSTIALLFKGYVNYLKQKLPEALEHLSVYYFTFIDYVDLIYNAGLDKNNEDTLKRSIDQFLLKSYNMSLEDFKLLFVNNHNCIIILDESQFIYHHKYFWRMLKANKASCSLVAFSLFTSPNDLVAILDVTAADAGSSIPYAFLAFTESEFKTTVSGFVNIRPDRFAYTQYEFDQAKLKSIDMDVVGEEDDDMDVENLDKNELKNVSESKTVSDMVSEYIKEYVISPVLSDGVPLDEQKAKVFHPGLTFSLLYLFLALPLTELYGTRKIYKNLLNRTTTRFFPSFASIEEGFCRLDRTSSLTVFRQRFRRLLFHLLKSNTVSLVKLELTPQDLDVYRKLLVRHAFFCTTSDEDFAVLHSSCKLVRTHFWEKSAGHDWGTSKQAKFNSIDQYIETVVSHFSPKFPNARSDRPLRKKDFQDQFMFEANFFEGYKVVRKYQTEFKKTINNSSEFVARIGNNIKWKMCNGEADSTKKKDWYALDFLINGPFKWGIELLPNSHQLKDHIERFEEGREYHGIGCNDYRVLDCVHLTALRTCANDIISGPKESEYLRLTQTQANKVIIAEFSADLQTVTFKTAKITDNDGIKAVEFKVNYQVELQYWIPLDTQ